MGQFFIDILNSASRILQCWSYYVISIAVFCFQNLICLLFIFAYQVFIDPTFSGIFVCGPLQSFVVNVCTLLFGRCPNRVSRSLVLIQSCNQRYPPLAKRAAPVSLNQNFDPTNCLRNQLGVVGIFTNCRCNWTTKDCIGPQTNMPNNVGSITTWSAKIIM